jgi:hypothetical protein
MQSTSAVAQLPIISPHVRGVETETFLILSKISEQKEFLKNILKKYKAQAYYYCQMHRGGFFGYIERSANNIQ